jgi:two-component system response regulator NreC
MTPEPDLELVGEAEDGDQVLQMVARLHPDLVVMDISMPGQGGIDALRQVKEMSPEIHVLMLTIHEDDVLMRKALRAGASGYVVKRAAESELLHAIRAVWRGDIYIHPTMTRALLKDLIPSSTRPPQEETLTPREVDVLRLIARGYTNSQIAKELTISARTVEGHRANLMGKLNLHSRVELVEYAEHHNLLD